MVAAALLGVEGLVAAAFAVSALTHLPAERSGAAAGLAVVMAFGGAVLVLLARGVWRTRWWVRGPAVATQLIVLPTAWSLRGTPTTLLAVAVAAVALATLIGLLHPASTAAFVAGRPPGDRPADG